MKKELIIRFSKTTDLPFIVEIYNQAIRSGNATGDTVEFNVDNRTEWFEKFDNRTYPIYIAEMENRVVGFCILSPYRPGREAMLSIAEISYYLDYSFHNKGIGTALLNHVISDCIRIRKESLLAILLDINYQSIRFLEKMNFKKWGHFPNIIHINGKKCGQLVYGLKTDQAKTHN